MVSKNILIGRLDPFTGKKDVITYNQDTKDIISGILHIHDKYRSEYDKIYKFFDDGSVDQTAYNVWEYLKDNFKYRIEPEDMQILRSPSAIIGSDSFGIDCKCYSLFSAGIMDAYRRNTGKNFDLVYRFASYDPFDTTPQHVFAVVKDGGNEYWIDPVLDEYDEKKQPYYFKDKNIQNMALVALSGVGDPMDQQVTATGGNWFEQILQSAPSIISAFNPQPQYAGGYPSSSYQTQYGSYGTPPTYTSQPKTGISTNTLLLIGAVGLGAYFLLKKKRK
jgi:LPXTG-motif cell wall-anchored protein